jgi:hypothetical protein
MIGDSMATNPDLASLVVFHTRVKGGFLLAFYVGPLFNIKIEYLTARFELIPCESKRVFIVK